MIASEIIELAQNTELKQLGIKNSPEVVLNYINLGILEIHKKFSLIQQEAIITVENGTTIYTLNALDSNVSIDLSNVEFLVVDAVYNEDGDKLDINDEEKEESVTTPSFNVVEIPASDIFDNKQLSVIYRATPKFLTSVDNVVNLPIQFLEPLLKYIEYKAKSSLSATPATETTAYYNKFLNACNEVELKSLITSDSLNCTKFNQRGFV